MEKGDMNKKTPVTMDEDYLPQLQAERDSMDPSYQHATKLLDAEIAKVKTGRPSEDKKYIEVQSMSEVTVSTKLLIPNKAYPKHNFVGKLLGPKGTTMKKLQADTMCRMAVMGRGSMKDKKKEEELRKQGGKNSHLDEPLHIKIDAFGPAAADADAPAPVITAYQRLVNAIETILPFLQPEEEGNQMQGGGMGGPGIRGYENGGGEPERMARGIERPPYREDPYYQEPAPAPVARGFSEYRARDPYDRPARPEYERVPPLAGARDPYDRVPPARAEYERLPSAGAAVGRGAGARAAAAGVPAAGRGAAARDGYYDYPAPVATRERYADPYESRVGVAAAPSSGGTWGAAQTSYKGMGAPARSRLAAERPHPYQPAGRGAPRY